MKMWASAGFLIPSKHDQTIDRPNPLLVLITLDFAPRHAPSAIRIMGALHSNLRPVINTWTSGKCKQN